jgi:Zn-dependent M16 (insulinase) family peptidase
MEDRVIKEQQEQLQQRQNQKSNPDVLPMLRIE